MTTQEQRDAAREKANRVRLYHANLKRDVAAGRLSLTEILDAYRSPSVASCRVHALVRSIPRVGSKRTDEAFRKAGISMTATVGSLTARQRGALVDQLERFPAYARQAA